MVTLEYAHSTITKAPAPYAINLGIEPDLALVKLFDTDKLQHY